ncbi:U2-type spliceosomal complex subunit CWC24 KNAG_0C05930 [Huiozyma naganishii CBS 8797]|uniref:Pre-mRNA-splicing factor CWC24 n=1 Tax=Huiozyma naganishii (strain ATCC MYA-139 / BCRC 22969 / CBS 8797 / KCTC 17520 / NBRC 10181 / NCYC 3082 / Yp74L-3) TaxID=1071383 RepID=J7S6D4_HUIN7|nr:hypothetical protein KNAG_0C05930 [Kazachstania naganishii CBS 8797]CCK69691.1 hypothetical protein KNAG_0C05930 [Kazachstania naganishii CBS 8797]
MSFGLGWSHIRCRRPCDMFKKRSNLFLSGGKRKRAPVTESPETGSDSDATEGDSVQKVPFKRRHIIAGAVAGESAASRRVASTVTGLGETSRGGDDGTVLEGRSEDDSADDESVVDKTLTSFVKQNQSQKSQHQIKQAANLKNTILVDYQPDICKDFKQTGYCGYGDSCKFLHSRDDFKAGWKLNQDWKIEDTEDNDEASEGTLRGRKHLDLEKIPFKCVICKQDYKSPIVTNCEHYFCRECFFKRTHTDSKCFICGKETNGSAKIAAGLKDLITKKNKETDKTEFNEAQTATSS